MFSEYLAKPDAKFYIVGYPSCFIALKVFGLMNIMILPTGIRSRNMASGVAKRLNVNSYTDELRIKT